MREKEILVCLVEKYFKIIENKKTNAVFNKEKQECWEKLACEFNATQTTEARTGAQLKMTYEKMKQLAKQHKSEEKVEILKTGGGSFVTKVTNMDEKILKLLKTNYFSIDNRFDSNSGSSSTYNVQAKTLRTDEYVEQDSGFKSLEGESSSIREPVEQEDIFIVYEEDDAVDDCMLQSSLESPGLPPTTQKDIQGSTAHQPKVYLTPNQRKRKITPLPKEKGKRACQPIFNKKMELLEKKNCILDLVKEVEMENLKSKKLDNEIKEIIKEKEMVQLQIKKKEYENLVLFNK